MSGCLSGFDFFTRGGGGVICVWWLFDVRVFCRCSRFGGA
jgi:hypothetical protein